MARKAKPNGVIVYRGPSLINGKPIVAIVTALVRDSKNPKTGKKSAHLWILPDGIEPHKAWKVDADKCVCGDCPLRKVENGKRVCYVQLHQAPLAIYRAYKNGKYPTLAEYPEALEKLAKKELFRLGAYGDPTAIPFDVVKPFIDVAKRWTGYTHQWRQDFAKPWKNYLQASCETMLDMAKAVTDGWKVFRVVPEDNNVYLENEVLCPSNNGAQCERCGLCNGRKRNVYITVHGSGKKFFRNE